MTTYLREVSGNDYLLKVAVGPMFENCHVSASTAPRHLKIGKERAYTIIYHKVNLFLSRSNYVSNNMA